MPRQYRRIALALLLSLAGCALTLTWYYVGAPKRRATTGRDAVARLTDSTDEVQRRETTRVMWELVSLNDELFTGEAIRTSARATAKIRLHTGATIHLEPDSLVVLERSDVGLALDFLEGNLFVQGGEATGVTLRTGQGDVSLAQADVSLSRGAGGDVDLEVHRGRAELRRGEQTKALAQNQAANLSRAGVNERAEVLRLTAPAAGQTVLLNLARGERLPLVWSKLAPGYRVRVSFGPSRAALTEHAQTFAGEDGRAEVPLKPGKWFVRLTARAEGRPDLTSLVTPFELAPRVGPTPLEPGADQEVRRTSGDVRFRWLNRHAFAQQLLEVSRDPGFRDVLRRERLDGDADQIDLPLADGTYHWRVTGFPGAGAAGLSSHPLRLRVISRADEGAAPVTPLNHARLNLGEVRARGLGFTWTTPSQEPVTLTVRSQSGEIVFTTETTDGAARVGDLAAGRYRWTVGAAAPFEFTVVESAPLTWADETVQAGEYTAATPALHVAWRPVAAARAYRYRFAADGDRLGEVPWSTTERAELTAPVPADGTYHVEVEALDHRGEPVATSPARAVRVRARPLLGAPAWPAGAGALTSDARGNVRVEWDALTGARGYEVLLTDEAGQVTRRAQGRGPAALNRLRPGRYELRVRGVDEFDRPGTSSAPRTLEVPSASDIRAPKIKAMKVR